MRFQETEKSVHFLINVQLHVIVKQLSGCDIPVHAVCVISFSTSVSLVLLKVINLNLLVVSVKIQSGHVSEGLANGSRE